MPTSKNFARYATKYLDLDQRKSPRSDLGHVIARAGKGGPICEPVDLSLAPPYLETIEWEFILSDDAALKMIAGFELVGWVSKAPGRIGKARGCRAAEK
jgi:hypothetical protein